MAEGGVMSIWHTGRVVGAACLAAAAVAVSTGTARAANGAYVVDDSAVGSHGECKIEQFLSSASNHDFIGAVGSTCALDVGGRVWEFSGQVLRFRQLGEWGTGFTAKAKTNILPVETGKVAIGWAGGPAFNLLTSEFTGAFSYVPITYQVVDNFRLLVNAGWLWDKPVEKHFFTWGAGFEWEFVKKFTLIAEVYGILGPAEDPNQTKPRMQAGLRFTPVEAFDIDVIYGRNLAGEQANWITVGLNVRFPPPGKK
jgi:hypothetical protein